MLIVLWLGFTTGLGYIIGLYFPTHLSLCSLIGFVMGLLLWSSLYRKASQNSNGSIFGFEGDE
jgi:hypothetical protein